MRKQIRKIVVALLIITFIIHPFLMITMNVSSSYAYEVTVYEGATGFYNASTHTAVKKRTYKNYKVTYKTEYKVDNLSKKIANELSSGTRRLGSGTIQVNNVTKSVDFWAISGTTATSKTSFMNYKSEGIMQGSFETGYIQVKPSRESLGIAINGQSNRLDTYTFPDSIVQTGQTKHVYEIIARSTSNNSSNSGSNSGSNNNGGSSSQSGNSNSGNSNWNSNQGGSSSNTNNSGSNSYVPSQNTTPTTPTRKTINISDDAKRIYIRDLYKNALHREPSNTEIESHMTGSVYTVSISIILSKESDDKNKIKTISNEEYVKSLYKYIFNRDASEAEYQSHANKLKNGTANRETLIDTFVGSNEFELRKVKKVSTITLNEKLHDAVYNDLVKQGFSIISPNSTTIKMYEDYIPEVKLLNISGKKVEDLSGLSVFTNLNKLVAYGNSIKDVSELQKLNGLKFVNLNGNELGDNVRQLSNIVTLEELYLDENGLITSNVNNAFNKLKNLKTLTLAYNSISSVGSLEELKSLNKLILNGNKIVNTDEIDKLSADSISLRKNEIYLIGQERDVTLPIIIRRARENNSKVYTANDYVCTDCKVVNGKLFLNDGKNVGTITIKGGIADGTKFTYTCNLQTISFKDQVLANKLQEQLGSRMRLKSSANGTYEYEIDANALKSIKYLDLSSDGTEKIINISGIEKFTNLTSLDLSGNKIANLNLLETLPNLQSLKLRRAELTTINMIRNVKTLTQLDVANNNITEISKISNLENLEDLVLSNNNIGDNLAPLKDLSKLSSLAIANNNVTSLAAIGDKSLEKLDISYNNVSNLSNVKAENVEMENNTATVTVPAGSKEVAIPTLLQTVIKDNGGTDNLEFTDCSINNNSIVLKNGVNTGRILAKEGKYSDFSVVVNQAADVTPPVVKVSYKLNEETGMVDVTLQANEEIKNETFFIRSEDCKSLTKSYDCNTQEVINVRDLAGNETPTQITVTQLHNEKIPGLKVFYSNTKPTNQDITFTIKADVPLHNPNSSVAQYYTQSEDGKTLTWVMDRNIALFQSISSEADWQADRELRQQLIYNMQNGLPTEEIQAQLNEINARTVRIRVSNSNVDKVAPETTVEYSTTEKTKGSVRATIWSNEEIELVNNNKNMTKAKKTGDNDETLYGVVVYYSANANETLTIKDLAGNTTDVNISVNNIDSSLDGLSLTANQTSATKEPVSIFAKANELIKDSNSSQGKIAMTLKQRFNEVMLQARLQNESLKVANVDNNTIIRIAENNSEEGLQEQLSYEYNENEQGVMSFYDEAGNIDTTIYNVSMIDTTAPVIERGADVVNEDGSIVVTLIANEEIQKTEDILDWELSADGKTLTKIFNSNKNEVITVKDLAGNETQYKVDVHGINSLKFELEAFYDQDKNQYLVKITAETELKELDGWELSEDRKTLQAYFNEGEKQYVLIEDIYGNNSEVEISLTNNEEAEEDDKKQEENKEDKSTANDVIPQTGSYVILAGILILILSALTAITIKNYMLND